MKAFQTLMLLMLLTAGDTVPAAAGECFKLEGPKDGKKEVPVDCAAANRSVMPPVTEKIDIAGLMRADPKRAAEMLGPPYHSYDLDGHTQRRYGPHPNISIEYQDDKPITIMFDVTGVASAKDIPAWLGLDGFPAPVCFEPLDGVFWLNPPGMRMLEVHNPSYKIDGQYVYTVIVRLPSSVKGMAGLFDARMYGLRDGRLKPGPCR